MRRDRTHIIEAVIVAIMVVSVIGGGILAALGILIAAGVIE